MNESERRRFKRITPGMRAEFLLGGSMYGGMIENLSENGLALLTFPTDIPFQILLQNSLEMNLQPHAGEALRFHCRIKWLSPAPPRGSRHRIGLEIIGSPWEESAYFL